LNLSKIRHVSIIGQGNVALDVARILLKPLEELKEFDLPNYALEELNRSRVETVEIVGRRGILQLAGTTKELREMLNLKKIGFKGIDERVMKDAQRLVGRMGTEGRAKKRALGLLEKGSSGTTKEEAEKNWSLEFLKSPRELLPAGSSPNRDSNNNAVSFNSLTQPPQKVGSVLYDLNELVPPPRNSSDSSIDPSQFVARSTGETQQVSTDMVFKSVGYRSIGLPGLPFDEKKGIVRNDQGRVIKENGEIVKFFSLSFLLFFLPHFKQIY
jgi:adrenodoxin-NADP+ reductase